MRLALKAFLTHRKAQNAPSTTSGSRTAVTHLIELVGEEADPATVAENELQHLCDEFLGLGYRASSVRNLRNHLVAFFDWLEIVPNPARNLKIPENDQRNIAPWSAEDLKELREAADAIDDESPAGPSRRLLIEHLLAHGTRIQETAAALWEDIDPVAKTARVYRQIDRETGEARRTKGKKPRSTTVMPEWWTFHRNDATGLIFSVDGVRPIPYRTLYAYVCEVLERAGLKRRGEAAHQFRHTYAFMFLDRGGSISNLQKCLGHKRESTTIQYYDHFTSENAASAGVAQIYGNPRSIRRGPRGAEE